MKKTRLITGSFSFKTNPVNNGLLNYGQETVIGVY